MPVILFILAIVISVLIVRLGATALELTGMERRQARFQALSAFSGTGFTTREAEMITTHPARRRVVTLLIVFGNAGIISMIGTLAGAIGRAHRGWVDYAYFALLIVGLLLLHQLSRMGPVNRGIQRLLRALLKRHGHVHQVSFEEVLLSAEGFGVSQIEVHPDNPLLGKTLAQSGLASRNILVLMIERAGQLIAPPAGGDVVAVGDRLTCFGRLNAIREAAVAASERDVPPPAD